MTITLATAATNALLLGDSGVAPTPLVFHFDLVSSTIQGGSQTDTTTDGADLFLLQLCFHLHPRQRWQDVISVTSHVKSSTVRGGAGADSVNIDGATISSAFIQGDLGNDTIDAASTQLIKSTVYGDNGDSTTSGGGADSLNFAAVTTLSASNVFAGAGNDFLRSVSTPPLTSRILFCRQTAVLIRSKFLPLL